MARSHIGLFVAWLRKQVQRQDVVGDFARDFTAYVDLNCARLVNDWQSLTHHLEGLHGAGEAVLKAADAARHEFVATSEGRACAYALDCHEKPCLWCGKTVAMGEGVLHVSYGVAHEEKCSDLVSCAARDFTKSRWGRLRSPKELRHFISTVKGRPLHEWIDFQVLAWLEPQLHSLLATAKSYLKMKGKSCCANAIWYGYGLHHGKGLKSLLCQLVGHERIKRHAVLSSSFAYDVAYDTIYDALPECRNCICL